MCVAIVTLALGIDINQSVAPERLNSMAVALLAVVALALAMVGTYGLLAYTVAQRTHQRGVRVALGARREDLVRLVLGQASHSSPSAWCWAPPQASPSIAR